MAEFDLEVLGAEVSGIAMEEGYAFDYPQILICPACREQGRNQEYSHIRCVYTALGDSPHEGGVAYPGTEARGTCGYRRDCLVITVDGECQHAWEIRIQQDKGINYVMTRMVENKFSSESRSE